MGCDIHMQVQKRARVEGKPGDIVPHGASAYRWEANDNAYTLIQWEVPLLDYTKHFLEFVETLSALGPPDEVRLVFGFDS